MTSITLSASIRTNLLSLQNTTKLLDLTSERLSSGLKVNSALDNPSAFFAARSLTNRANDLNNRKDSIGQAISLLESTDKNITSLTSLVEQAKAVAQQAEEAATAGVSKISSKAATVVAGVTTISTAFTGATNVTDNLDTLGASITDSLTATVNGDGGASTFTIVATSKISDYVAFLTGLAGVDAVYNSSTNQIDITANGGTDLTLDETVGDGFFTGLGGLKDQAAAAIADNTLQTYATANLATDLIEDTFGITDTDALLIAVTGGGSNTFTSESGNNAQASTIQDLIDAINSADGQLTATYNTTTSKIDITAVEGVVVTFTDSPGTVVADLVLNDGTTNLTQGVSVTYSKIGSAAEVAALTIDFQSILDQINGLITDSSFKGTNLLKGSSTLDVKFNVKGDSKLTVTGKALEADSNGILSGLNFTQKAADYDFETAGDITSALADVDLAIAELRSVAATFGTSLGIIQTREEFTTDLVNALETGAGKLVNASLEEEAAKLLALQTRQALGIQSLAIANTSQQSILALFR